MNRKSLIVQEGSLKSYFPASQVTRSGEIMLTWHGSVRPSPLSATYKLKLCYRYSESPKVYVIDPKPLALAPGKYLLPHVYSTPEQQLCLYYPKDREWDSSMLYVHTLIPWACEWLCHYELWVSTGTWHGGGIHHETDAEKEADNQTELRDELERNINFPRPKGRKENNWLL
jgi:hypothetical protein